MVVSVVGIGVMLMFVDARFVGVFMAMRGGDRRVVAVKVMLVFMGVSMVMGQWLVPMVMGVVFLDCEPDAAEHDGGGRGKGP